MERIRANWTNCGWGSTARSCLRRIYAAQSWFEERDRHLLRLGVTIPRLTVMILRLAVTIPSSQSLILNNLPVWGEEDIVRLRLF